MEEGCEARPQHPRGKGGSPIEPLPAGRAPSTGKCPGLPVRCPREDAPPSPQPSRYRAPPRGDAPFLLCLAGGTALPPLRRRPPAAAARSWLMAGPGRSPAELGTGGNTAPRETFPGKCFPSSAPPPRGGPVRGRPRPPSGREPIGARHWGGGLAPSRLQAARGRGRDLLAHRSQSALRGG